MAHLCVRVDLNNPRLTASGVIFVSCQVRAALRKKNNLETHVKKKKNWGRIVSRASPADFTKLRPSPRCNMVHMTHTGAYRCEDTCIPGESLGMRAYACTTQLLFSCPLDKAGAKCRVASVWLTNRVF